nr:sensor histidine kinase [uncultured Tyzzerella sp.]
MLTKNKKNKSLLQEILQILLGCAIASIVAFYFLYFTSISIANTYLYDKSILFTIIENTTLEIWIKSICFFAGIIIFISLFLFLLGQKISYLVYIIGSVEKLKNSNMDFSINIEGNNELTQLAQSINFLAISQKEVLKQEKALKEEREEMIRSLSHDIRTPLTSILSYSDYLKNKENITNEEFKQYIQLILSKSEQIKILTDKLLGKETSLSETIENGKLFIEQLLYELEEILEDKFIFNIDLSKCDNFKFIFKIEDLKRIFDNIASNIEKYADCEKNISIYVEHKNQTLTIIQQNYIKDLTNKNIDSNKIGLKNIEKIINSYDGSFNVSIEEDKFKIIIVIKTLN